MADPLSDVDLHSILSDDPIVIPPVLVDEHRPVLVDEHERILQCVGGLVDDLVAMTMKGRWPASELRLLVDCLQSDVLPQALDEETGLLVLAPADPRVRRLIRDHARLRLGVEVLERAAENEAGHSMPQLASLARGLLVQLRHHVEAEQGIVDRSRTGRPGSHGARLPA